jgi:hypothetical protein
MYLVIIVYSAFYINAILDYKLKTNSLDILYIFLDQDLNGIVSQSHNYNILKLRITFLTYLISVR